METQPGFTLWLTGMHLAGKTTLARYLAARLPAIGRRVELLDDEELDGLFAEAPDAPKEERDRNVRALGAMARLLTRNGVIPIVASVSPYREARDEVRRQIGRFFEIFVDCNFEGLLSRDSAGVYQKALAGSMANVVGVQAPYQTPANPEVKVESSSGTVEQLAEQVFERLFSHGFLTRRERDVLINGGVLEAEEPAPVVEEDPIDDDDEGYDFQARQARTRALREKAAAEARQKKAAKAPSRPAARKAAKPAAKAKSSTSAAKAAPKSTRKVVAKPAAKTAPARKAAKVARPAARTAAKPAARTTRKARAR